MSWKDRFLRRRGQPSPAAGAPVADAHAVAADDPSPAADASLAQVRAMEDPMTTDAAPPIAGAAATIPAAADAAPPASDAMEAPAAAGAPPAASAPAADPPETATSDGQAAAATAPSPPAANPPDTSALNAKIVQAVGFSNDQVAQYLPRLVQAPPEVMATQTAGHAVQDAANYMNAIMQIALATQAVVAKKAAEGPAQAAMEIPLLLEMQKMVSAAVDVYGSVSQTAGQSAKTIIGDVSSS